MKNFKGKYYIHKDSTMSVFNPTSYARIKDMTLLKLFLSHITIYFDSTVVKVDYQFKKVGHEKRIFYTVTSNLARLYIMDIPKCVPVT